MFEFNLKEFLIDNPPPWKTTPQGEVIDSGGFIINPVDLLEYVKYLQEDLEATKADNTTMHIALKRLSKTIRELREEKHTRKWLEIKSTPVENTTVDDSL